MPIADEIYKLEELRRTGVISDEEFLLAKQRVLSDVPNTAVAGQLEDIKLESELARMDREWEMERERYIISGRHGHIYVPQKGSSIFGGIVLLGFGIFWTAMASSVTNSMPSFGKPRVFDYFPMFGVLFMFFGGGMCLWAFLRADQYEKAHQQYQLRRDELIAKYKNQRTS